MDAEKAPPGCEMFRDSPAAASGRLAAITRKVYMRSLRNSWKLAAVTALTLSLGIPVLPQEPDQGPALKKTVNLVNLFATVRDKGKRIVGDLKQEDFKVFEDGEEQKIAFFSKEVTLPITLGLLIDTSGSEQNRL